jgi:hypothetical protein
MMRTGAAVITKVAAALRSTLSPRSGERVARIEDASRVRGYFPMLSSWREPITGPSLRSGHPLPAARGEGGEAAQ